MRVPSSATRRYTVKRYWILTAAVVMQMCLGATYSWSIYVHPLKELTGMLQGTAQLPFSLFYFAFPATMIFTGSLLPRIGPRFCAVIGGVLFGSGWLLASLGRVHFFFTLIGIGLMAGVGVGFAYIVPIATCIRWFPEHKGLVTGVAVAGFGGGAALVSQIGGWLMRSMAATPFQTFGIFGGVFFVLVVAAGLAMENPPGTEASPSYRNTRRSGNILSENRFWLLYLGMFTGLAAGFAVNANLKELYPDAGVQAGVTAVSLFALANAAGRITWGAIFDRVRSAVAVQSNLMFQGIVVLAAPWVLKTETGLQCFALLTGFNYGGVLVVYASSTARNWGSERVGQIYGWLFSANIPAALSPILAGFAYDMSGNFNLPMVVLGGLLTLTSLYIGTCAVKLEPRTS